MVQSALLTPARRNIWLEAVNRVATNANSTTLVPTAVILEPLASYHWWGWCRQIFISFWTNGRSREVIYPVKIWIIVCFIFNLNTALSEMGLQHKSHMFVVFWRSGPCTKSLLYFTLYFWLFFIFAWKPTFVHVTLLSSLTKILHGCVVVLFFSGRNSNLQNRGFVFRRYKTLEGTTTYATKYVELCCPFSNKKLVESNQIFKFITYIFTNTVQILYCFTCEAAKWYKNKAVSRTKKSFV